jgi:membrane protease YdiL (CAAX protease family)
MSQLRFSDNLRTYLGSTLTYGLRLAAVVVLSAWALRKVVGGNPWGSMFPRSDWWKDLLFGFLLAFVVMLSIFILEIGSGWLVVESWRWQSISSDSYFCSIWLAILINLSVAVGEETMFRGYFLSGLKKAWGTTNALLIMAFIFAALHLVATGANEMFPILFILLLSMPGVILGGLSYNLEAFGCQLGFTFHGI